MADFGLFSAERFGKNSSVSCFAEIFAFENIFGSGKRIDKFGFAFVGYVAQYQIAQGLQRHDTPARIGFTACKGNSLPQILFDNIFSKLLRAEERSIYGSDILHACLVCGCFSGMFSLIQINRGIVMNVDVVTGIIVSMKMDLKNNWSHDSMNETADIKSTGAGAINIKVCKL